MPADLEIRFSGTLTAARGGGAAMAVDADVRAAFGEVRPTVTGTVNGIEYRSRLMVYGGVTYLGLTKAIRSAAGIEIGEAKRPETRDRRAARAVEMLREGVRHP